GAEDVGLERADDLQILAGVEDRIFRLHLLEVPEAGLCFCQRKPRHISALDGGPPGAAARSSQFAIAALRRCSCASRTAGPPGGSAKVSYFEAWRFCTASHQAPSVKCSANSPNSRSTPASCHVRIRFISRIESRPRSI